MSQQQQQMQHEQSVPTAPYPPMNLRYAPPGTQSLASLKSSLSSSPHYTANFRSNSEGGGPGSALSSRAGDTTTGEASGDDVSSISRPLAEVSKIGRASPYASQIQMCPSLNDTVACINCASPYLSRDLLLSAPQTPLRNRKSGPILLDLRRIELATATSNEEEVEFFTTRTVGLSRGNPSLGTSVASTCLDLPTVNALAYQGGENGQQTAPVAGATGLTTGALCIHAFGDELDEDGLITSSIEYYHTPRHHRQASAVAWRPTNLNHVAIGLLGSGSGQGPQQGAPAPRRGGTGVRAGGDREFCCFLWDIEAQQASAKRNATPMSKLSHNAAVASLAWLLDGQTLAVGSQSKNIQLYDMRVSGTNVPPISANAHYFGVHGIQVHPFKPEILATFSRAIGEPVKLWDVRRMDKVVSEIKLAPTKAMDSPLKQNSSSMVSCIRWSTLEPGLLSVAIGDSVHDYDTSLGSRPALIRVNHTKQAQPIVAMALYEGQRHRKNDETTPVSRIVETLYPHRMLAVLGDRKIHDMPKHTNAPIAISRRDGRLVHALGRTLWIGPTNNGPTAMESLQIQNGEDISATMMRRARCLHLARYSMDTASNIKMLSEEKFVLDPATYASATRYSLLRLWSWIERVEALSADAEETEEYTLWPARGLVDAGIWRLLRMDEGEWNDELGFSESLSCTTYDSQARR